MIPGTSRGIRIPDLVDEGLPIVGHVAAGNPILATGFASFSKVQEHPWRTVYTRAALIRCQDLRQQPLVINGSVRQGLMQPLIKPATSHLEHATHGLRIEFVSMIVDEPVLYSGSLAKYRAAFFRISRSSSIRRI